MDPQKNRKVPYESVFRILPPTSPRFQAIPEEPEEGTIGILATLPALLDGSLIADAGVRTLARRIATNHAQPLGVASLASKGFVRIPV